MGDYIVLAPEITLIAAALVVLFSNFLGGDRAAAIIGVAATVLASVLVWSTAGAPSLFGGMLYFGSDTGQLVVRSAITSATALFLLWVAARGWAGEYAREAVSMTLFAAAGGMLLVSANDLVVMFMAMELATMPAYVLVGYVRDDGKGLEGALKYFLLSMLTGLVMAYGLSWLYTITGSTSYSELDVVGSGTMGVFACTLVLVGFLAKVTAAPLHLWAPDAYEGASTPAVAYVSSIAKIGPMVALVKFASLVMSDLAGLSFIVLLAAVASMLVGNLVALGQTDVRRMTAYSGVASSGYMLLGVSAGTVEGYSAAIFFVVVYVVGVLGLLLSVAQEGATFQDIAGLVNRRPYAAWSSVVFLFSIIGFPPMVGFFGKLTTFSASFAAGNTWAVVVAILMSVVSGGYAFNVIRAMFTPGEGAPEQLDRPSLEQVATVAQWPVVAGAVVMVLVALVLGLGIVTEPVVALLATALP